MSSNIDNSVLDQQLAIQNEHWVKQYWRPSMGWLYMAMCAFDFIIFPLIMMFLPVFTQVPYAKWESLTLSNGGLIHLSFGAILGVYAFSRSQEKMTVGRQA
jgi:hypothetical protein